MFAGRYHKNFRVDKPINTQHSASVSEPSAEPKTFHKAKGFADDLTIISSKADSHQQALISLALKAADICFEFQPPKCVSLHFNGHRVVSTTEFSMSIGNTINICSVNCTKFLARLLLFLPLLLVSWPLTTSNSKSYGISGILTTVLLEGNTKCGSFKTL